MEIKNKILLLMLGLLSFVIYLTLLILVVPNKVPILFDASEKILATSSKWILIIFTILPLTFATLIVVLSKKRNLCFLFKLLFVLSLYENILFMVYFSLASSLAVGALCEIPISIIIFLPLSVIFLLMSIKLKNAPYLGRFGINFKSTRETEFIWKQTHLFARDVYFLMSFALIITSIVFSFFRLCLIELGLFIFAITTCTLVIYFHSRSLYKKYMEMKNRRDSLEAKNSSKKEEVSQ